MDFIQVDGSVGISERFRQSSCFASRQFEIIRIWLVRLDDVLKFIEGGIEQVLAHQIAAVIRAAVPAKRAVFERNRLQFLEEPLANGRQRREHHARTIRGGRNGDEHRCGRQDPTLVHARTMGPRRCSVKRVECTLDRRPSCKLRRRRIFQHGTH